MASVARARARALGRARRRARFERVLVEDSMPRVLGEAGRLHCQPVVTCVLLAGDRGDDDVANLDVLLDEVRRPDVGVGAVVGDLVVQAGGPSEAREVGELPGMWWLDWISGIVFTEESGGPSRRRLTHLGADGVVGELVRCTAAGEATPPTRARSASERNLCNNGGTGRIRRARGHDGGEHMPGMASRVRRGGHAMGQGSGAHLGWLLVGCIQCGIQPTAFRRSGDKRIGSDRARDASSGRIQV